VSKESAILRKSGIFNDRDVFNEIHDVIKRNFQTKWKRKTELEALQTREFTILAYDVFRDAKKKHYANQAFSKRRAAKRARVAEASENVVEVGVVSDDVAIDADLQTPAVDRAAAAPTISPSSIDFNALAELGFGVVAISRE
jgi:hypothetical protein